MGEKRRRARPLSSLQRNEKEPPCKKKARSPVYNWRQREGERERQVRCAEDGRTKAHTGHLEANAGAREDVLLERGKVSIEREGGSRRGGRGRRRGRGMQRTMTATTISTTAPERDDGRQEGTHVVGRLIEDDDVRAAPGGGGEDDLQPRAMKDANASVAA